MRSIKCYALKFLVTKTKPSQMLQHHEITAET